MSEHQPPRRDCTNLKCAIAALAIVCFGSPCFAREDVLEPSRWAIVGDGSPDSTKLVELLTAELSKRADLRLVERELIGRIMEEQKLALSGLVEKASTLRLGQLLPASALLAVEQTSSTYRLRLIETRSGIVLWDYLGSDALDTVEHLADELQRNTTKLKTKLADRRHIAFMGFVAEESSGALRDWEFALPALLEQDLRKQPDCCILERQLLQRLIGEQELTDVELQLRAASVLVEGSLRKSDQPDRVDVTLKLLHADGSPPEVLTLKSIRDDLPEATHRVAQAILHTAAGSIRQPVEMEATLFAERADWLISNGLVAQARGNAHAAAAIAPTRTNVSRISWIHTQVCADLLKTLKREDFTLRRDWAFDTVAAAIREARVAHQYQARELAMAIEAGDSLRYMEFRQPAQRHWQNTVSTEVFVPHVPVSPIKEPQAVASERELLRREMLDKYELVSAEAKKRLGTDSPHRHEYLLLLRFRLSLAAVLESSPDQYAEKVLRLMADIEKTRVVLQPTASRRWPASEIEAIRYALSFSLIGTSSASLTLTSFERTPGSWYQRRRAWSPEAIQPVVDWLATHSDPAMRLLALERKAWASGDPAVGVQALEVSKDHFDRTKRCHRLLYHMGVHFRRHRTLTSIVEPYIKRMEQSRDPSLWASGIFDLISGAEHLSRIEWTKRLLRAFPPNATDELTLQRGADLKLWLSRNLRAEQYAELANLGPETPSQRSQRLAKPEGPWNDFEYETVDLKFKDNTFVFYGCFGVHPRTQAPELLLMWSPDYLQRIRLDGEVRSVELARAEKASADARALIKSPTMPAGGYINYRHVGILAALDPSVPLEIRPKYASLRWHNGRLYAGYEGLQEYDPATKRLENLATSLRLDARSPLDATNKYRIAKILSDPKRDCIYFTVSCRENKEIAGIWRYRPSDRSFKQLVAGRAGLRHWTEGKLLIAQERSNAYWHLLDPDSLKTTPLAGYAKGAAGIKVGPYLISSLGILHTKDGKSHRFPLPGRGWQVVMPIPNGFVAAEFDDKPARVWRFKRKTLQPDNNDNDVPEPPKTKPPKTKPPKNRVLQVFPAEEPVKRRTRPAPVRVTEPEGAWNEFTYETLDLKFEHRDYVFNGCFGMHPRTKAPELLLLWSPNQLQRISLDRELRIIESVPADKASASARELIMAPTTPSGKYWDKCYRAILESVNSDLPDNLYGPLRWLDGRLFLGHRGLRVYDPSTRQIRDVPMTLKVDSRPSLALTRRGYSIGKILADKDRNCLYLQIHSRESEAEGIWRYRLADQSVKQVVAGRAALLHWSDDKLLFQQGVPSGGVWHFLLDPDSLKTKPVARMLGGVTRELIRVGPYTVNYAGELRTKAGKVYRFPLSDLSEPKWNVMMPIKNGFVAAAIDTRPTRVWKFQWKTPLGEGNDREVSSLGSAESYP